MPVSNSGDINVGAVGIVSLRDADDVTGVISIDGNTYIYGAHDDKEYLVRQLDTLGAY